MNGEVSVKTSSISSYSAAYKLVNYNNEARLACSFINEEHGFIQFDFKEVKVQLTNYAFHSAKENFFKSTEWKIEGSNDRNDWRMIDSTKNIFSMAALDHSKVFKCKGDSRSSFRFIRITAKRENIQNITYFEISALEFFGSLITKYSY